VLHQLQKKKVSWMFLAIKWIRGCVFFSQMFQLCGEAEGTLATESLQVDLEVENTVIKPVQDMLDVIHFILYDCFIK